MPHDRAVMTRGLVPTLVASLAVFTLCDAASAAGGALPTQWFRAKGGWAYCAYEPFTLVLCFSTVTGRWIEIRDVPGGLRTKAVVSTGTNRKHVGFRRARADSDFVQSDGRPQEYWMLCETSRTFLKCGAGGRGFWLKKDGTYRLTDSVTFPPFPIGP